MNGALCYALLLIILHPDVQKKVQDEIDQVVPSGRDICLEDKSRSVFCHCNQEYSMHCKTHPHQHWLRGVLQDALYSLKLYGSATDTSFIG